VRASRLLAIMSLLHVRGRVSAQQLADELEVSLRTVYRDIEALSEAGVPVYAVRGRAGGFALLDGYRPGFTGLTGDEADALFLTGLPGPAAELGLGSVLAATQVKLLAALPPPLRERAARIRDRFHLDAPGWLRETEAPPALSAIAEAVWAQRRLRVHYERANRALVDRRLDPLGIVLWNGSSWDPVPAPGIVEPEIHDMNDCGQIVGAHHPVQFFKPHAFLIANGTAVDLNSQIPSGSGWRLGIAAAINDSGEIAGVGRHNGLQHAFLLEPTGAGARCP